MSSCVCACLRVPKEKEKKKEILMADHFWICVKATKPFEALYDTYWRGQMCIEQYAWSADVADVACSYTWARPHNMTKWQPQIQQAIFMWKQGEEQRQKKTREREKWRERKSERQLSNSAIWLALLHYNILTVCVRVCVCAFTNLWLPSIRQMQPEQRRILIY